MTIDDMILKLNTCAEKACLESSTKDECMKYVTLGYALAANTTKPNAYRIYFETRLEDYGYEQYCAIKDVLKNYEFK